jgi:hypothetical protein
MVSIDVCALHPSPYTWQRLEPLEQTGEAQYCVAYGVEWGRIKVNSVAHVKYMSLIYVQVLSACTLVTAQFPAAQRHSTANEQHQKLCRISVKCREIFHMRILNRMYV